MNLSDTIVKIQVIVMMCLLMVAVTAIAQLKKSTMQFDYATAWKNIKEFEDKGLPQSALTTVNSVYEAAKKEGNAAQLVKAVIHQLKFTDYKEENAFVQNLERLKKEADESTFPVKPLLHSMLGEMYWQYYQNNRYRFLNRTAVASAEPGEGIETWSLKKIVEETFHQYKLSLIDADRSRVTPVGLYEEVILKGNTKGRRLRPTLYDFLAHRALAFCSNQEAGVGKPSYAFNIDDPKYFSPATEFVKLQITTRDSLSMTHFGLTLFQELIRFHLNDADVEVLTDVDVERLRFVKDNYSGVGEPLYLQALRALEHEVAKHPVSTRVLYLIAQTFMEKANLYKPLQGEAHKWDLRRAMEICDSAKLRFKDSEGAILCENLQHDIQTKSLTAVIEENNLPQQAFRGLVRYRNFTDLHYRIVKITRDEVASQRRKWERNYNVDVQQKFISYFLTKQPVTKGQFTLPNDNDYQEHSLEVKLDALPVGEYMILYSNRADFSLEHNSISYAFTTISGISFIHRNSRDGGTDGFVVGREKGEPLAGVTINVFAVNYNYKSNFYEPLKVGTFTSDAKGYFRVPYMKKENQRSFYFEFSYKGDKNSTQPIDQNRYYGGSVGQYKQEDQPTYTHTYFFLDRSIYRPGQTIFFKGLVVSTDGKTSSILPGHKTKLTLYDVNSQVKGEVNVTANEYGTYSGSFTAPSNGLTGEMHLQDSENTGNASFSVEEYKRPKFEIVFDTLKGSFKLNDTIQSTGKAMAYSGASIDGAVVKYRVVRIARFPYWWWYRWGYYPTSPQMEIIQGETKTDAEGKFSFAFAAIPDPTITKESEPTFAYTIYADVTDINGETHSNTSTVSVGYKSLELSIPITNINIEELKDNAKEIALVTTNLAGMFEETRGNIEIFQLKAPSKPFRKRLWEQPDRALYTREQFYQLFPSDLFDDEGNKYKWEHEKRVLTAAFNTGEKKTFSIPDLKQWTPGEYVVEATALDKSGQQVKAVTYFTVYAPHDRKVPSQLINYFQPIKEVTEPGELASFVAGSAEKDVRVLYEVEQDGQIISSQWINFSNEQRYFEIPIKESYRGNIGVHWTFVKNNRLYTYDQIITVPFTNKTLDISFETFRDKLQPGQQEQWKILIKGKKADEVMAEMVASLYDESLDTFRPHAWYTELFGSRPLILHWQSVNGFDPAEMVGYNVSWYTSHDRTLDEADYDELNWFEYSFYDFSRPLRSRAGGGKIKSMAKESLGEVVFEEAVTSPSAPQAVMDRADGEKEFDKRLSFTVGQKAIDESGIKPDVNLQQVATRKNFNETAFFYPHLQTNDKGEIVIKLTIPEALTRWKMLGFAHTKDLKSAMITKSLITQKELMVVPNQPRFFREGDKMTFAVKISSLVDTPLSGQAQLEFFDPFTSKPVAVFAKNASNQLSFTLAARQSTNIEWSIEIPEGLQALSYKVVAKAGNFSDGEEMTLPVLTNRMLVTETLPLPIRGKQSKDFQFKRLADNGSPTLKPHRFTLEFTSNPAWYAVQALPYMMEYPYDCVEQTFSKFYANSIASHIANANPRIRQVFDTWKNIQPDALLSNLEKNQELKSALLEETPWVLQANNEKERKRNVGLLFDLNKMANERDAALEKVIKAQRPNGGFSWFPGFPEDRYMTQHIVSGLGHLDALDVQSVRQDAKTFDMLTKAIRYLDNQIQDDYDQLKARARKKEIKLEDKHIGSLQIHYLYARSNFKDNQISAEHHEAFQYYLTQAKKYWLNGNLYLEGMTCLALHRFGENQTTEAMIKSFRERSLQSDEMGMYWKNETGYYWYQAPIETQALMIEVFDEVAHDAKAVEELKVWLLKQKQTQDWKTTKATAEACYALLRRGMDILSNTTIVDITVGKEKIDPNKRPDSRVEAGTGYFKTAWQANEISASMGNIHVEKKDEGVAWGAAYYQYFEQLDKITTAQTPLRIKKDLFKESNTATGPTLTALSAQASLKLGDLVKVRILLQVDRDMEYVHLKDMRAAGLEPVSTISTHHYQDGLYYYESPRDMATNFFIAYLPKGSYVFEYALRVSQKGDFSNGITTIQCMYAPEFSSHSQGIRINIK